MSAMGITQIAAVTSACVAGGTYLPIMSDETFDGGGNGSIFLAGPYLVKAAVGEDTDTEKLGGAATHTEMYRESPTISLQRKECLDQVKDRWENWGLLQPVSGVFAPRPKTTELYGIIGENNANHDMPT